MKIGAMTQRVTFQAYTEAADGAGGKARTWADVPSVATVWADVRPSSGGESLEDGAHNATGRYVFRVRNRTDISERDRILWAGEPYNIRQIRRAGGRPLYLEIEAERGVAQ